MNKKLLLLILLLATSTLSFSQEKEDAKPRIELPAPKLDKRPFRLKDSVRMHQRIASQPEDNMPILKPEGNFAMRVYKPDTTLIFNMPVAGLKETKKKTANDK
ncbi:hypothetical protein Pedsa_1399 [Pseudopedobacter saltans DSM 12145]|uniref:Uncharacterized protein n=1 Tax=Pseudopedobacter saltans (strain ATCC 51119 / DSM 12145 / JCM 21818 / CCUG 39354 / LMG 10337 / NBRC 100064 / NCIMB 13643) TaxID=762903 RepID=F0S4H4_PSESL|nr:hypothetical protein [Pseudopedobacter saltans]ADY51965.1 hypothetical protein Pedsa_1399 [Pseudopedobacter saltans DSM 12145]